MLSGNTCAFPNCPVPLVDEGGVITAEICHIKAKNAGGKRYDASQTNQERDDFENLILMCPIHHTVIDADEEVFTIELLQQIKKNHNTKTFSSYEQGNLETLLENYLRSITEKVTHPPDSSKSLQQQNSSLIKARKLAAEKTHNERRQDWLVSYDGLVDVINSVNEIFSLINNRFSENAKTFATLGIELNDKVKQLRVITNYQFGCQIELKGFQERSNNRASNISLKIWLFKKHEGGFNVDSISRLYLKPDLTLDGQVVWKDEENAFSILTAEDVCEKMFDLLIDQINKKPALDETIEGGRFLVNSQFVDAWGNPIENDEYTNDDDDISGGW